jgi:hypothetical protein
LLLALGVSINESSNTQTKQQGILGLLEEGREFMLRPGQTAEAQHRMVYNTLAGLMTPVMPPIYKTFMSGTIDFALLVGTWQNLFGLSLSHTHTYFTYL